MDHSEIKQLSGSVRLHLRPEEKIKTLRLRKRGENCAQGKLEQD